MSSEKNRVELSGIIINVKQNQYKDGATALMELYVPEIDEKDGKRILKDHHYQKVVINTGDTAIQKSLTDAQQRYTDYMNGIIAYGELTKKNSISLTGELTYNTGISAHLVAADEKSVIFLDQNEKTRNNSEEFMPYPIKNDIECEGRVVDTFGNLSYATVAVELDTGKQVKDKIPGCVKTLLMARVSAKDEPECWSRISQGDYKEGDLIKLSGKLFTLKNYNGKDFRESVKVKIASIEKISKKVAKTVNQSL